MSGEIVDKGDEILTPTDAHILCRYPYIRVDKIEPISAPILVIGEWMPMLLPELSRFTNLAFPATKLR